MIESLHAMRKVMLNEIYHAKSQDELHRIHKFWQKFFAQINKYLAGKCDCPYIADDGWTIV